MNITAKSKYALHAVIEMARTQGKPARREDLAAAQGGISLEYLEKILLKLRRKNLVKARTGPGGGYFLARPSNKITAWNIISAVEDAPEPVSCLGKDADKCHASCEAKGFWAKTWAAAKNEMKNTTIASLVMKKKGSVPSNCR